MTINISIALVDRLRDIAERAGEEIMKIYRTDFEVAEKADASPVTAADQAAEALIIRELVTLAEAFPIVAEEAVSAGRIPDVSGSPFWLVDPLDGTKEFIRRGKDFTVNIALIEKGRPVAGVVHAPALNATYWGSRHGAFATTGGGAPRRISARPKPTDGLVVVASRSHRSPALEEYLSRLTIKKETRAGSSLKFCTVASGQADLYPRLGRTMEWDTAAGHAVVLFAGGSVRTLDGKDLAYGKPGFENPDFVVAGRADIAV